MFHLVFNPGSDHEERLPFTVSEANLEDGLDIGRVEAVEPFEKQLRQCAYHMVLELDVCDDLERISGEPWVILHDGKIIGRNHLAAGVDEDDLA